VKAAVCMVSLLISLPAFADRPARHNIDWYVRHGSDRGRMIRLCESDHSYDWDADCANAHSAETRAWVQKTEPAFARLQALSVDPRFTSLLGTR
jgi:hypothetical protein